MTADEIHIAVNHYALATRRAIQAGFDGVEVHGANHYLLQQFFSAYSNCRTDEWGGSLERRMAFPLAVLQAVKQVAEKEAPPEFIVGYRISPEEVHGETVGYTIDQTVRLIDRLIAGGIHYLHVSMQNIQALPGAGGMGEPLAKTVHKCLGGRVPMLLAGGILTPNDALHALYYTDMVALARAVLIDPDFVEKIAQGRADEIEHSVSGRLDGLAFPPALVQRWQKKDGSLPPLNGLT